MKSVHGVRLKDISAQVAEILGLDALVRVNLRTIDLQVITENSSVTQVLHRVGLHRASVVHSFKLPSDCLFH